MKRAAIYARVSTHNGQNPEMQLGEVRTYCARRGWEVVQEYVDGVSQLLAFGSFGGWRNLNVAVMEPFTGFPCEIARSVKDGTCAQFAPGEGGSHRG